MRKYIIPLLGLFVLLPFVGNAQQFECPSDWNCFPKSITACPIGYACVRYSDGFRIDTDSTVKTPPANVQAQPTTDLTGEVVVDYQNPIVKTRLLGDLATQIKIYQDTISGLTVNVGRMKGTALGQMQVDSLQLQANYYQCLISDLHNQISYVTRGEDPAYRPVTDCSKYSQ